MAISPYFSYVSPKLQSVGQVVYSRQRDARSGRVWKGHGASSGSVWGNGSSSGWQWRRWSDGNHDILLGVWALNLGIWGFNHVQLRNPEETNWWLGQVRTIPSYFVSLSIGILISQKSSCLRGIWDWLLELDQPCTVVIYQPSLKCGHSVWALPRLSNWATLLDPSVSRSWETLRDKSKRHSIVSPKRLNKSIPTKTQ